jgi:hypothetical protein
MNVYKASMSFEPSSIILQSDRGLWIVRWTGSPTNFRFSEPILVPNSQITACFHLSGDILAVVHPAGSVRILRIPTDDKVASEVPDLNLDHSISILRKLSLEEASSRAQERSVDVLLEAVNHLIHTCAKKCCSLKIRSEFVSNVGSTLTIASKLEVPIKLYQSPDVFCA